MKEKELFTSMFHIMLMGLVAIAFGNAVTQIILMVPALYSIMSPIFLFSFGLTNILWWSEGKIMFFLAVSILTLVFELAVYIGVRRRKLPRKPF